MLCEENTVKQRSATTHLYIQKTKHTEIYTWKYIYIYKKKHAQFNNLRYLRVPSQEKTYIKQFTCHYVQIILKDVEKVHFMSFFRVVFYIKG